MQRARYEVCVEGASGVVEATRGGADRIELCTGLLEGGLTPGPGILSAALEVTGAPPIVVLLRPRGGDFLYDRTERRSLEADVDAVRLLGFPGVALGALCADGTIDLPFLADLVARARPMAVTFHRAFDLVREPLSALEDLMSVGVDRLLTSGGAASATEGTTALAGLVERAGTDLEVIAAGSVRPNNAAALVTATGVPWVHGSAGVTFESPMAHRPGGLRLGAFNAPDEFERRGTDAARVRAMMAALGGP